MKKYTFCLVVLFLYALNTAVAQKAIKTAADESCKCIEEKYDKTNDYKSNENLVNNCIQQAFLANVDAFTEEYGMEIISDQDKAYKIGEELGIEIAKNCPAFIDFSMQMAKANEVTDAEASDQAQSGEINGKVVRVENKEFVHLIIQNADGKETDLIWLRYFQNSDQYKGRIQALKGKNITASYKETEVYLPKVQNYFSVKEITGIQLK